MKNILTQGYPSVSLPQEMPVLVHDLAQISTLLVNTVPDLFFFFPEPEADCYALSLVEIVGYYSSSATDNQRTWNGIEIKFSKLP
jgi:hypothetical protein